MNRLQLVNRFARALAYHDADRDYYKYCEQHEYDINSESFGYWIECKAWFITLYPLFSITELRTLFDLTHSEDV